MQRETKEIVSTSGKKVVIKAYLTGKESNEIKKILVKSLSVDADNLEPGQKPKVGRVPLTAVIEKRERMIEIAAISFEGSEDKVSERIGDLPSDEYDDLVTKVENELKVSFQTAK